MSFVLRISFIIFLHCTDGLRSREKPTIVSIQPFYNNGSIAPETIFDVDKPGTIEIHIYFQNSLMLNLEMIRNKVYTSEGYKVNVVNKKGTTGAKVKIKENCRFYGQLKDSGTSDAALTFCNGISGYVYSTQAEYRFKPIGKKMDEAYVKITPLSASKKVEREKREHRYSYDRIVSVIELYIVNDYKLFEFFDFNVDDVFNWALEVVSMATRVLQKYDLHIVLAGMEVWDIPLKKFKFKNNQDLLTDWLKYKREHLLERLPKHDTAFLFTSKLDGSISRPMSVKFAMCDMHETGGIIWKTDTIEESAVTLLFHIGRLLGLRRESEFRKNCSCPSTYCIMEGNSSINRALAFSSCSLAELRASLDIKSYPCLVTPAKLELKGVCGNGYLEGDEECDCGNLITKLCNPKCCDVESCMLYMNYACASGRCCDLNNCNLKPVRTLCRKSFGKCDVKEYCDGLSPQCPPDEGADDGTKCGDTDYCFSGRCGGRLQACQRLWGARAIDGAKECYAMNLEHRYFGHCYADYSKSYPYVTCNNNLNMYCGILMCNITDSDINDVLIRPTRVHKLGLYPSACKALEYRFWKYDYNPGYVPDGSGCDSDKVCFKRRCISVSIIPHISKYFFSLDIGTTFKTDHLYMAALVAIVSKMLK